MAGREEAEALAGTGRCGVGVHISTVGWNEVMGLEGK